MFNKIMFKVGDRVKIVKEAGHMRGYFERNKVNIGDIITVTKIALDVGGYGFNKQGDLIDFLNEEIAVYNSVAGCKFYCPECKGKCDLYIKE